MIEASENSLAENQIGSEVIYDDISEVGIIEVTVSDKNVEDNTGQIYGPSEVEKPTETTGLRSKVGRHITKKITGRFPQKLKPHINAVKEDIDKGPETASSASASTQEDKKVYMKDNIRLKTIANRTFSNSATKRRKKLELKPNKRDRKVNIFSDCAIETGKLFQCDACPKSFPFKSHLARHLTVHNGIKHYTCDYCHKQFTNAYNLRVHLQKHTGDFPLRCNICKKGYSSPSLLKRHLNTHTSNIVFQCKYCLKTFSQSSSLRLHERMHLHRPSYSCDVCPKVFAYSNSLAAHKKTHSSLHRYVCGVCEKGFTAKYSLGRHMKQHDVVDDKKLQCGVKGSSNKTMLKSHVKKVKGQFKCEQCFKQFVSKTLLISHLQKHINVRN